MFACLLIALAEPTALSSALPPPLLAMLVVAAPGQWPLWPVERDLYALDPSKLTGGRRFPEYNIADVWSTLRMPSRCASTWAERLLSPLDVLQETLAIPWLWRFRFGPPPCWPSTRWLQSRGPGSAETMATTINTQCDEVGCTDRLTINGRAASGSRPAWVGDEPDRLGGAVPGDHFDRYIGVFDSGWTGYVSVLIGEQQYGAGGAHYVYSLRCRTFAEDSNRPLRLRHLVGARGEARLLSRTNDLFLSCDDDKSVFACDGGPSTRGLYWPEAIGAEDFRVESGSSRAFPRVILCMHDTDGGGIVEIPLDQIPATWLLR